MTITAPTGSWRPVASWLIRIVLILGLSHAAAPRAEAVSADKPGFGKLVILDPVDLSSQNNNKLMGAFLYRMMEQTRKWKIIPRDTLPVRLNDFGIDPETPCHEFQCGFDAGSAVQAEYVLFGTVTTLPDQDVFTFNLLHIPSAQVVWSRAGESDRKSGIPRGEALQGAITWTLEDLDPSMLNIRKHPSLGMMAVLDASNSTAYSRTMRERALTHVYESRSYDLQSQSESDELFKALNLKVPDASAPREDILALGRQLDVRYLLCARFAHVQQRYRSQMELYDIAGGKLKHAWPARESYDFSQLLLMEDRVLASMEDAPPPTVFPAKPAPGHPALRAWGKGISVVMALGAGAGLGYLAYQAKQSADNHFQIVQSAQSQQDAEAARSQVSAEDTQFRQYAALSGFAIMMGTAVWAF